MPLAARAIVLNFGLNEAKKLFERNVLAESEDTKTKIIKTCCVVKTFVTWHQEKAARICRERCGGASYLNKNRLPDVVLQAHSGMTAEGDNRVLMQKVVKDIFEHTQKKRHDAPHFDKERLAQLKKTENLNLETMKDLILMKEPFEIKRFAKVMKTKIMEQERKFYDVWMFESNDDIQALASAFGERFFLQSAWKAYESCQHQGAKDLLGKILRLHMVDLLKEDMGFYLVHDLMSQQLAK